MDIRIAGIFLKNASPEATTQNHIVKAGLLLVGASSLIAVVAIVTALLNTLFLLSLELLEESWFEEHDLRFVVHLHRTEKGEYQSEKGHPRL